MRINFSMLVLSATLLVFLACSGEKKSETTTQEIQQIQSAGADTVSATCPGCNMVMAKSEMIQYTGDGKTLYFCSEQCRDNYLAAAGQKTDSLPQQ
jgi:YHS domain-containing protein